LSPTLSIVIDGVKMRAEISLLMFTGLLAPSCNTALATEALALNTFTPGFTATV